MTKKIKTDDKIEKKPNYTPEESQYIGELRIKLEDARDQRDTAHVEFDGLDYISYYNANEDGANTTVIPKDGEVEFKSGTLRTKLFSVLSSLISLNLRPDIMPYNKYGILESKLGKAMKSIVDKINEDNEDEELQMLRYYELLKQGTVFVDTCWEEDEEVKKKILGGDYKKRSVKIKEETKRLDGKPKRRILSGLGVFLGNIRIYDIKEQPYIFTVEVIDYSKAQALYGDFEMFQYVSTNEQDFSGNTQLGTAWRLYPVETKNKVEVVKYQNLPDNEYQIILNGVPMLQKGYPLPWGYDGYSIDQQNLEPIRFDFAYGKSFIFKNKNIVAILDEMTKLAILKTQKSYKPPYINQSGRFVSKSVFDAGKISVGLRRGDLIPITENEVQGVTNSEFAMIQEMINFIDKNTVSQTFGGQRESGSVTATQIVELQRQAKIMMGYMTLAATLLESKLTLKMLLLVLDKWFEPLNQELDPIRNTLNNKYRQIAREKTFDGGEKGLEMILPTEEMMSREEQYLAEEVMSYDMNMPVRMTLINPKALKEIQYNWIVTVNPEEKKSSELNKLLLEEMITKAITLGIPINIDYVVELFAEAYELDPEKLVSKQQPMLTGQEGTMGQGATPDLSNIGAPKINKNTPSLKIK